MFTLREAISSVRPSRDVCSGTCDFFNLVIDFYCKMVVLLRKIDNF